MRAIQFAVHPPFHGQMDINKSSTEFTKCPTRLDTISGRFCPPRGACKSHPLQFIAPTQSRARRECLSPHHHETLFILFYFSTGMIFSACSFLTFAFLGEIPPCEKLWRVKFDPSDTLQHSGVKGFIGLSSTLARHFEEHVTLHHLLKVRNTEKCERLTRNK